MEKVIIQDQDFKEKMKNLVEPYLAIRKRELWPEREPERKIHCVKYHADNPKAVVMISHGYTETAEKYKEIIYYFLKAGNHVYMPEHCGHGYSYRLTDDLSLVYVDTYKRYVEDFLFVSRIAREENPELPMFLYGHSMGGGIAAAVAAQSGDLFRKVVLSSPMIRPLTGKVPWRTSRLIAGICCLTGKSEKYVIGQEPYTGEEDFENSSSTSIERYEYYQEKRRQEPLYQLNAASYGWLYSAARLNGYLQRTAWRKIRVPVLIFQAENDHLVSKREQERFVIKLNIRGLTSGKMMKVPGIKHEIFNSSGRVLEIYWKKVFAFLREE